MAEPNHLMDAWDKLVADCNRDPCYAGSWAGGLARRELAEWWERECPGLDVPQVLWSHKTGKYELTDYNVPKNARL